MTQCVKGRKPRIKLKGEPPRFYCKRCSLESRKKKHLCKPKKIRGHAVTTA